MFYLTCNDQFSRALDGIFQELDRQMTRRVPRPRTSVVNEANLFGGESVGGSAAEPSSPATPDTPADDSGGDGDGDPDPEPERRPLSASSRLRRARAKIPTGSTICPAENAPASYGAKIPDALANFDVLPDAAHVRLPVVCGLFACSPATAWRRAKAGILPSPVKLSDRVTAWRVGDLRAALAELRA